MAPKKAAPAARTTSPEKKPAGKAAGPASPTKTAAKPKRTGPKTPHRSRNPLLARGITKLSRSAVYHKKGLWAIKQKNGGKLPTHSKPAKAAPSAKKAPKFYPPEDVPKPLHKNVIRKPTKLRSSITPGTVLILLSGHFKGKRVVFLKQLKSGLLLVTGPFKLNGVPLRRVNQAYVIATSTKVDISSADVSKYTDEYFKREVEKKKKGESEFFEAEKDEKKELPQHKIEDQKAVDSAILASISKVQDLSGYLASRFSLKAGMKPHELVF
jgi:large subunit ribosomal protein L6e